MSSKKIKSKPVAAPKLEPVPEPVQQDEKAPSNQEIFAELCGYLQEACSSLEKMSTEKDVDEIADLKFDFYSLVLGVSDELKDILKAFRKKYKITERQVRERMAEEDGEEPGGAVADGADAAEASA